VNRIRERHDEILNIFIIGLGPYALRLWRWGRVFHPNADDSDTTNAANQFRADSGQRE